MTKSNKILAIAALALPVIGLTAATVGAVSDSPATLLQATAAPTKSHLPKKVVKIDGFLYEDFESVLDGEDGLPDGWVATATPGMEDDTWHAGTLGRDGTPLNGVSGYKYAYILGNRNGSAHDSWLFSPGLEMKAGTKYVVEFFALMPPVTGDEILEKLQVYVCSGNSAADVVTELDVIENDNDYWRYYGYEFTPETDGTYNIGFHSISPANSNSTVIDDLKISSGPLPLFNGDDEIDLGTTDTRLKLLNGTYRISNRGMAPLEVSLLSASEGVEVEGLPLTIAADDYENIKIKAVTVEASDYEGSVTLKTNDPTRPTMTIKLTGTVKQARLTGYNYEDFEAGGPEGWDLSFGSGNVALYGGHNSSRAFYTTTVYYDDPRNEELNGVGFTTHYVDMGDNPEVSFWYQMAKVDFSGNVTGPAETGDVSVKVLMTADDGKTYDTIYSIEPDGEHSHQPTLDWTRVFIRVPQYAGKICRLRVVFNQPSGASFFNQVRCMADDVEIGTIVANDLRATALTGPALLNTGKEYEFEAYVENLGSELMSNYKVQLLDADGNILDTADGVEIEPSGKSSVKLHWTPTQSGKICLNALIVSDSDPIQENNQSYAHYVQVLPEGNSAVRIEHGDALAAMAMPINFYAVESATQSIYLANEIGTTAGEINSLVYTSYLDADFYGEPFQVYVAETDLSEFSTPDFIDPASFTKVFDGSLYMKSGTRDVVIPFDAPFEYKGGNIVVMCQKLGKEFVMGKYFIIHKCPDSPRTIQSSSYKAGTIAADGYADAITSDVYPRIRFNMVKPDAGIISGNVTGPNGAIEGAIVKIKGTQRFEITDYEGYFYFDEVAVGQCALEVSCHGYYTLTDTEFSLEKDQEKHLDLSLTSLPRYSLQGTVTSAESGKPIKNVQISLSGYDDFTTFTDSNGHYTISDIAGDTGLEYNIIAANGFFMESRTDIDVDNDKTLDFTLEEKRLRAHNAKATPTDQGTILAWEQPMPEFRHDSGIPVDYMGWTHGNNECIIGTAFHKKAEIKEISWYVTDKFGAHSNFNVFIFGLDEEGKPNPKDILYVARNVEYKDNAWSTHIISNPVKADGFMIAVSCDGFIGMGFCEPTDEYPFAKGQNYYAGDSYNMTISDMSTYLNVNPMIRAYGEDLDYTKADSDLQESTGDEASDRPEHEYKVFRGNDGAAQSEWVLLGTTQSLSFIDKYSDSKPYFYAIVTSYASGDSDAVISNSISSLSVGSINDLGVNICTGPIGDSLTINGCEKIASLILVGADGKILANIEHPDSNIDVSHIAPGVIFAIITLDDGSVYKVQLLKK